MNSLLLATTEEIGKVTATGFASYAWLMVAIPLVVSGLLLVDVQPINGVTGWQLPLLGLRS